jgi:DNA-binding protein H-NS
MFRLGNRKLRMVRKLNLDAMSVDEIWQLHETIIAVLATRLTAEKYALEKRLAQLRHERDTSLFQREGASPTLGNGTPQEQRKYNKVSPKYRNPDEPSETWSGRGKRPRWLTAALLTGHKIEDFVIGATEPTDRSSQNT